MRRSPVSMEGQTFDVLIIGGGINGTGIARDVAMRGLSVALIDKGDFGHGTTSRSTRLAHGGLRYLEMLDFALVRESLREREFLLQKARHLVRPVPFIVPVYRHRGKRPSVIKLGMRLYDLLSYDKSMPSYQWLSHEKVVKFEPKLNPQGLMGGALYYDAQINLPERLCIENVQSAHQHGAEVANYVEFKSMDKSAVRKCMIVNVKDVLTRKIHTIHSRVVVNATGPWSDHLNIPGIDKVLRTTKGAHIIVEKLTDHAIVMLADRDGRMFFCIPWNGYSLIGTTDTDYTGNPDKARANMDDVNYLINETQRFFPGARIRPIYSTMAGIRPLVRQRHGRVKESAVSRRHLITDNIPEQDYGVISVAGGKLTNFRSVAEEVTDRICDKLGIKIQGRTRYVPTYGGNIGPMDKMVDELKSRFDDLNLPKPTIPSLVNLYGSRAKFLLEWCRKDPELVLPVVDGLPHIMAQVAYALDCEMVQRSTDFLLRRSGIGLIPTDAQKAYPQVSAFLRRRLNWDKEQVDLDREQFEAEIDLFRLPLN